MDPSDIIAIIAIIAGSIVSLVSLIKTTNISIEQNQLLEKTIMLSKHPYLVLEVDDGHVTKTIENGRRWLNVNYSLKNIGDSPAISVYCCAHFELQHTLVNGINRINMDDEPYYIHAVEVGKEEMITMSFEQSEIESLISDMQKSYSMNMERIRTNPSHEAFHSTMIVAEIYYSNVVGQWFKYVHRTELWQLQEINQEIMSVKYKLPKGRLPISEKEEELFNLYYSLITKMDSVPPGIMKADSIYELHFVSEHFNNSQLIRVSKDKVRKELSGFHGNSELFNALSNYGDTDIEQK